MDESGIEYRPNRMEGRFAPIGAVVCMAFCLLLGACLQVRTIPGTVCSLVFVLISVFLTKHLYDLSKVRILLEAQGLRLIHDGKTAHRFIPWETVPYGCRARSSRGHSYLVLSPVSLRPAEADMLADKGVNSSRIWLDGTVVIHLDLLTDKSPVEIFIAEKVQL